MQAISLRVPGGTGLSAEFLARATQILLFPVQVLVASPSLLFLATLTAMLLRHPDVSFLQIDRIAFGLLVVGVVARAVVLRQSVFLFERATWPMLGLTTLAIVSVVGQPFDSETWSLLASKFIVPFALFHLAQLVFVDQRCFKQFEIFALIVLAYLSFTAIAFLVGARWLIFPRFILDESLGFHADRARGPLLQAVANGVSLNILAVLALHAYTRGSARGMKIVCLLISVPIAILATMTRTVWLSFAGTVLVLAFLAKNRRLWRACAVVAVVLGLGLAVVLGSSDWGGALKERLEERGPVDFRAAVYAGGWEMFLERPLAGWGFHGCHPSCRAM